MEEPFMGDLLAEIVIMALLLLFPAWKIFSRAGLNPALSLLLLIPGLGGIIVTLILAFSRWPNTES